MEVYVETERLILRELHPANDEGMFELDSVKEVHKYLGNKPINNIEESRKIIELVRQKYIDNGIGRWALIEKSTNNFIGWTGLKLMKESINNHIGHYDLGYRLIQRFWGKGFATESVKVSVDYGFEKLNQNSIYAATHLDNPASRNVLEKCGLRFIETFDYNDMIKNWFEITRDHWTKMKKRE